MAYTHQYIGSRYVPLFADPAEWNSARTYEPLTIVLHEGNSYTSSNVLTLGNQPVKVTMESDNPQACICVRNIAPTNSDVIYIPPATINLRNITNIV